MSVGEALGGGVAGRHRHPVDVLRPERGRCQAGRDGGVDPARQAHHDLLEAALEHVIADPHDQGPVDLLRDGSRAFEIRFLLRRLGRLPG